VQFTGIVKSFDEGIPDFADSNGISF